MNRDAQASNEMLGEIGGFEQRLGMPPGSTMVQDQRGHHRSNQKSAAQLQFYQTIQKQASASEELGLVRLESEMSFDQARNLIHEHIMDLDI